MPDLSYSDKNITAFLFGSWWQQPYRADFVVVCKTAVVSWSCSKAKSFRVLLDFILILKTFGCNKENLVGWSVRRV
jgi:hypothetical protein